MKTLHNIYLDLSKLTRKDIIEVYTILKNEIILEETKKDLMTGTISEGFKYLFFSPSGWNQNDYPLNNKTEVTLSEFRELFQNLSNSTGLEKISAKDFILNNIPKLIHL